MLFGNFLEKIDEDENLNVAGGCSIPMKDVIEEIKNISYSENLENTSVLNLVENGEKNIFEKYSNIFTEFDSDGHKTIYDAKKFEQSIPQVISDDLRKQTLKNILTAGNYDINELCEDAKYRVLKLNEYIEELNVYCGIETNKIDLEINELKNKIDELTKSWESFSESKKSLIVNVVADIAEIEKFQKLIDF